MNRGRPDPKAQRATFRAAEALYASAAPDGKSRAPLFDPEPVRQARDRTVRNAKERALKSEAEVQRDIINWLLLRDDVGIVLRNNSGQSVEPERRVWYHLLYKRSGLPNMRLADLQWPVRGHGLFICEVKHEGWKGPRPSDTRACEQANYLYHMREMGHVAFFAQSLQDVKDLMP